MTECRPLHRKADRVPTIMLTKSTISFISRSWTTDSAQKREFQQQRQQISSARIIGKRSSQVMPNHDPTCTVIVRLDCHARLIHCRAHIIATKQPQDFHSRSIPSRHTQLVPCFKQINIQHLTWPASNLIKEISFNEQHTICETEPQDQSKTLPISQSPWHLIPKSLIPNIRYHPEWILTTSFDLQS